MVGIHLSRDAETAPFQIHRRTELLHMWFQRRWSREALWIHMLEETVKSVATRGSFTDQIGNDLSRGGVRERRIVAANQVFK